jgi:hypothetical protein
MDPRAKVHRDQGFGRDGGGGPSHCFNFNRDGHFQASCPNPPFCYNCKKDGHRSMVCPAKKGLNLKICGHFMPNQIFYSIEVPEGEDEEGPPKSFPGILSIKEGVVNEALIDLKLKHLFKGKSGWAIKKLGEDEYLIDFPSEELRNELTNFKGFEFPTAIMKAKVEPTNIEGGCLCFRRNLGQSHWLPKKSKKRGGHQGDCSSCWGSYGSGCE